MLLDEEFKPVEPVVRYIGFLESLNRSPHTTRSYICRLKLYWEFLEETHRDWQTVTLSDLSYFIHWLRSPGSVTSLNESQTSIRTESTVNHALSIIYGFYGFQSRCGVSTNIPQGYQSTVYSGRYKSFLHGIVKQQPIAAKVLKLKEPKFYPGNLSAQEVQNILEACRHLRDRFLIYLLYESGLRIGEALGLRHEDMISGGVNEIKVIPRANNENGARAKSKCERTIHVSASLMSLYSQYLIEEYPSVDSDYVFVNIWQGKLGCSLTHSSVKSLFQGLSKRTGIQIYPHLLRHTHATELIRAGWDIALVQKRLGHASVQTTIDTYIHLADEDMRKELEDYFKRENK
jgi:integrase/recombinase XerD